MAKKEEKGMVIQNMSLIGKVKKYRLKIRSISPLISNVRKKTLDVELKQLPATKLDAWESDQANWKRKAAMKDDACAIDGICILRPKWFRGAILEASKRTGMVPHDAKKKTDNYWWHIKRTVEFLDTTFACGTDDLEVYGDWVTANPKNPKSGKIWKNRPVIKKWETYLTVIDTTGRMLKEEIVSLFVYAGIYCGVGDARDMGFGKFELLSIEEIE